MQKEQLEKVMAEIKKEARDWFNNRTKGTATKAEMSAYIEGATATLAVIDKSFLLSNAALDMLEQLFEQG